ncbi:hypothetical protein VCRA2126O85_250061 [Vibrio crassostreae]|nr:hypothetical protein VCRA2128O106_230061 [Vibrio crassostreae]CAK2785009.1 hypothetical protein VCRA2127O91_250061 [Vibrio crassostreae]CAK2790269.1 hypothetical protein VCRA2126O85_250061 [Vibrio crassostreae]CAK3304537.1 hypothetical protein VCRA2128O105_240011 [Vibrio crassostreae]CAK3325798.1 hypothetical protein VCRA2125O80_220061 [Vibrio crassostreae]
MALILTAIHTSNVEMSTLESCERTINIYRTTKTLAHIISFLSIEHTATN